MDIFSFFSLNKKSDWEKGWAVNLQLSDEGIVLKAATTEHDKLKLDKSSITHGVYFSTSIDSNEMGMEWHKYVLDSIMLKHGKSHAKETESRVNTAAGAYIKVYYFSSDNKVFNIKDIDTQTDMWVDVDEIIKKDDIDTQKKLKYLDTLWTGWLRSAGQEGVVNPSDALFHGARGRYMWLKIELVGNENSVPMLKKIRIYYPRMSYLSYLPAVYQRDEKSRDFLERFLSLFATFLMDMEFSIDNIVKYFDAEAVPTSFLKWLSSWLAIATDDSWNEEQLRLLTKKAPEIYKKRGTKQAIEEMIEIYTGEKPIIVEYFQIKCMKENPENEKLITKLYDMDPYSFSVLVRQEVVETIQKRLAVQRILDEEKPAFTRAKLVVLKPWIYIDMHTYLGVNTRLTGFSEAYLGFENAILNYTMLSGRPDEEKDE